MERVMVAVLCGFFCLGGLSFIVALFAGLRDRYPNKIRDYAVAVGFSSLLVGGLIGLCGSAGLYG